MRLAAARPEVILLETWHSNGILIYGHTPAFEKNAEKQQNKSKGKEKDAKNTREKKEGAK